MWEVMRGEASLHNLPVRMATRGCCEQPGGERGARKQLQHEDDVEGEVAEYSVIRRLGISRASFNEKGMTERDLETSA